MVPYETPSMEHHFEQSPPRPPMPHERSKKKLCCHTPPFLPRSLSLFELLDEGEPNSHNNNTDTLKEKIINLKPRPAPIHTNSTYENIPTFLPCSLSILRGDPRPTSRPYLGSSPKSKLSSEQNALRQAMIWNKPRPISKKRVYRESASGSKFESQYCITDINKEKPKLEGFPALPLFSLPTSSRNQILWHA